MPWETKFNIDDALEQATQVFWAKGYDSTSLTDLLSAMNINKGSFYNTFDSKKDIFKKAVDNYESKRCSFIKQLERINNPIISIESLLDAAIEQSTSDTDKKGCFFINIATNLPNYDEDTSVIIKAALSETEAFIERQIIKGISLDLINSDTEINAAVKSIFASLVSLRVLGRGISNKEDLLTIKQQAMLVIKRPSKQ